MKVHVASLENSESAEVPAQHKQPVILVVEDDSNMRKLILAVLGESELDFCTVSLENATEAMDYIETHNVAVIVTDLRMPGPDGITLLKFVKSRDLAIQVVLVTGFGTVESAIDALKEGAFDFVQKPFDIIKLRNVVENALKFYLVATENQRLKRANLVYSEGADLIGQSQARERLEKIINAAANYDCTVLISGESGSGKEVVARQIHLRGSRADKPFIAINCAAIPETLVESELFGYRKGAFTGADRNKPGMFEFANGGTLFLDEINNAPLSLQAKLLRVIQDGSFFAAGATEATQVNVRVVAATNRPIHKMVEEKSFREDLYYRLSVLEISVPPLRERREDISVLAYYFLNKHGTRLGKKIKGLNNAVMSELMRYDWPGNVRELENVIQRMIIMAESDHIEPNVLPRQFYMDDMPARRALDYMPLQKLDDIEAYFIKKTLRETRGDRSLASEILGIDKSTLWRKIKRYGIEEA
ncbi:sigma-54 dependent transcriptional regulator [Thermithiobacillus plumbiphilus]|uniref:Sigma-54 dependent transcriptional regulator n=1 Tax=Thermithiobacillus plumbiphilus TaxID=1729899 RepID=A0ABU9DAN4_9PROT